MDYKSIFEHTHEIFVAKEVDQLFSCTRLDNLLKFTSNWFNAIQKSLLQISFVPLFCTAVYALAALSIYFMFLYWY